MLSMAFVLRNYVGLLAALLLPPFAFQVLDLSSIATGAMATLSAGLTLAVALLLRWPASAPANADVAEVIDHFTK